MELAKDVWSETMTTPKMSEKKMKTIYVVEGNCGEYSDRTNWLVKAFSQSESAIEFRDKLHNLAVSTGAKVGSVDKDGEAKMKEIDPQFRSDYTGTEYCILMVDFE